MSTETTNKKIKIDNGTTFGRTYTDKAVDELLKNVGGGGISVIELTNKNGTITSAQLGKINANPQNFAFKYNGKILLFTNAGSTTYQYCNNTTTSSDNNVMTTSALLTIESSTGVYTIAENVHNVVANSIHPVNGGDLTNIQVGSKVYSIPSGGGGESLTNKLFQHSIYISNGSNGKFLIAFTLLTSTPDKFTSIKAIHDYMIEAYGEKNYISGFVRNITKGAYGVHISPNNASVNSLSVRLFEQNTTNNNIGESIYDIDDTQTNTITDHVFKLI